MDVAAITGGSFTTFSREDEPCDAGLLKLPFVNMNDVAARRVQTKSYETSLWAWPMVAFMLELASMQLDTGFRSSRPFLDTMTAR